MDNVNPEVSASQVSKTSTHLSNIFREFNQEIHDQRVEFQKIYKHKNKNKCYIITLCKMTNQRLDMGPRNPPAKDKLTTTRTQDIKSMLDIKMTSTLNYKEFPNMRHQTYQYNRNNGNYQSYQYDRKPYQPRINTDMAVHVIGTQKKMANIIHKVQQQSSIDHHMTNLKMHKDILGLCGDT